MKSFWYRDNAYVEKYEIKIKWSVGSKIIRV